MDSETRFFVTLLFIILISFTLLLIPVIGLLYSLIENIRLYTETVDKRVAALEEKHEAIADGIVVAESLAH